MAYRTNNADICKCKATMMVARDPKTEFFFWSSTINPTQTPEGSNCYAFKKCDQESRIALSSSGNTYQLNRGKYSG